MATFETLKALVPPVKAWASSLQSKLSRPTKVTVKVKNEVPEKVQIRFKRYLVFIEKGAGRGYGGEKGGTWLNSQSERVRTNPQSLGKMGMGLRPAKPWFNPVIQSEFPKLVEDITQVTADASVREVYSWLIK